jgi:hypothetical protein
MVSCAGRTAKSRIQLFEQRNHLNTGTTTAEQSGKTRKRKKKRPPYPWEDSRMEGRTIHKELEIKALPTRGGLRGAIIGLA